MLNVSKDIDKDNIKTNCASDNAPSTQKISKIISWFIDVLCVNRLKCKNFCGHIAIYHNV